MAACMDGAGFWGKKLTHFVQFLIHMFTEERDAHILMARQISPAISAGSFSALAYSRRLWLSSFFSDAAIMTVNLMQLPSVHISLVWKAPFSPGSDSSDFYTVRRLHHPTSTASQTGRYKMVCRRILVEQVVL